MIYSFEQLNCYVNKFTVCLGSFCCKDSANPNSI